MIKRNTGVVVLAGGNASRMGGNNKAKLKLDGVSFLDRLEAELSGFDELLLSTNDPSLAAGTRFTPVADRLPGNGPLGGLYAALHACQSEALLVVPCDMPLFTASLGEYLCSFQSAGWDAWISRTRDGRMHPLCGIYRKSCLPVLEACLLSGERRVLDFFNLVSGVCIDMQHTVFPDKQFLNINTPADLESLNKPMMLAVCGVKNSGKTTFLEALIPRLRSAGLRVAVCKHDGHDFIPDRPGTDSDRLRQAGANPVAIISDFRYFITGEALAVVPEKLNAAFEHVDLVLLEGCKGSSYPKIELVRSAVGKTAVSKNPVAVVSDLPHIADFALDDYDGVARFILDNFDLQSRRIGT